MLIDYQLSTTSIILRVKIRQDTTGAAPGKGLTALTISSAGLIISTIADAEATPVTYTQAGSTIETISTLATFATPTATKCRFKLVDNTNHPGVYEIQLDNTRYAVANAKSLLISISGVSGMMDCDVCIPLRGVNPYDAVHGGMSALPNTACTTNASLLTSGTGTDQLSVSAGKVLLQATQAGVTIPTVTTVTNQLTAAAVATGIFQDTTAGDFTVAGSIGKSLFTSGNAPGAASGLALVGSNMGTVTTCTTLTNLPAITAGWLTATGIAASALNGKGDWALVGSNMGTVASVTSVTNIVSGGAITTSGGKVSGVILTDTATTLTGVPANFTSLAIDGTGKVTFSNASIATVTTLTNLPAIPNNWLTAAGIASGALVVAVWDGTISGHTTGGTFGGTLNAAGSAGDPLSGVVPGAYAAGTAGYLIGHNLDAAVSSRGTSTLTQSQVTGGAYALNTDGSGNVKVSSGTAANQILLSGGAVTVGVNNDKVNYALAAAGMDAVVVEAGLNARQALSVIAAASAGDLGGAATSSIAIAAAGVPATNRITAAVDSDGNRLSVTLNPPA